MTIRHSGRKWFIALGIIAALILADKLLDTIGRGFM